MKVDAPAEAEETEESPEEDGHEQLSLETAASLNELDDDQTSDFHSVGLFSFSRWLVALAGTESRLACVTMDFPGSVLALRLLPALVRISRVSAPMHAWLSCCWCFWKPATSIFAGFSLLCFYVCLYII